MTYVYIGARSIWNSTYLASILDEHVVHKWLAIAERPRRMEGNLSFRTLIFDHPASRTSIHAIFQRLIQQTLQHMFTHTRVLLACSHAYSTVMLNQDTIKYCLFIPVVLSWMNCRSSKRFSTSYSLYVKRKVWLHTIKKSPLFAQIVAMEFCISKTKITHDSYEQMDVKALAKSSQTSKPSKVCHLQSGFYFKASKRTFAASKSY